MEFHGTYMDGVSTDAESPSVRNFFANYKEEYFVCLRKKWPC